MGRGLADGEGRDLSACDATRLGGSAPRRVCLISCNHDAHVGSLYGGHLHARHRNRLDQWAEAERARRRQGVGSSGLDARYSEERGPNPPSGDVQRRRGQVPGRAQIKKAKNGIQPRAARGSLFYSQRQSQQNKLPSDSIALPSAPRIPGPRSDRGPRMRSRPRLAAVGFLGVAAGARDRAQHHLLSLQQLLAPCRRQLAQKLLQRLTEGGERRRVVEVRRELAEQLR